MAENSVLGVQKGGRLGNDTEVLLKDIGLGVPAGATDTRVDSKKGVTFFLGRHGDLGRLLASGGLDAAIIGTNVLAEDGLLDEVDIALELPFGSTRLCIAVPKEMIYRSIQDLAGLRIATSYPNLLSEHLRAYDIANVEIIPLKGSVEAAVPLGFADAVCDLVVSGGSLERNGLREVDEVYRSRVVLAQTPVPRDQELINKITERVRGVLHSRESVKLITNIPAARLAEVAALLPSDKGLTVSNVYTPATPGEWVAVATVVPKADFWELAEKLRGLGAEGTYQETFATAIAPPATRENRTKESIVRTA